MRVLIAHVRYRQPGGEDAVFEAETRLLREAGHQVSVLDYHSAQFDRLGPADRLRIAFRYADHRYGRRLISEAEEQFRPDVVHFHNLYPLLGPGAVAEAQRHGCATVLTLHNYRLSCLNGLHFREGRVCEDCSPGSFAAGIRHACYRSSRLQSTMAARATAAQWGNFVERACPTVVVALTDFMKRKYVGYGADPQRITVKANSVERYEDKPPYERDGGLFAGRLSREKGVLELVRSWPPDGPRLTVAGNGPLADETRKASGANVTLTGFLAQGELRRLLRSARVLVLPSLWHEGLPLVALEALAEETPVVAFRGGGREEVLERIDPGCAVPVGDFSSLCDAARRVAEGANWESLSERCGTEYRRCFSPETNLSALRAVYETAARLLTHGSGS